MIRVLIDHVKDKGYYWRIRHQWVIMEQDYFSASIHECGDSWKNTVEEFGITEKYEIEVLN